MEAAFPHIGIEQSTEVARSAGVSDLCRQYGIRRLSVFGSMPGRTRRPDSDLDLIVEFFPERTPGFAFARLAAQLSELFGMQVDLHTPQSLSRYFRDEVLREAREIYAAKKSDQIRIRHMVDAAQKAQSFTKGRTRRDLDSDDQLALATVRLIEIIGEAAAKITPETREAHPEIPLERYRRDTQPPHPRV